MTERQQVELVCVLCGEPSLVWADADDHDYICDDCEAHEIELFDSLEDEDESPGNCTDAL